MSSTMNDQRQATENIDGRLNRLEDMLDVMKQRVVDAEERAHEAEERARRVEEQNQELLARVDRLETALDANPDGKTYEQMSRAERVRALQHYLVKIAIKRGGTARIGYKDVLTFWRDKPSDGYAFKLMRLAAEYDDETHSAEKDGFGYGENQDGEIRLSVNVDAVSDQALVHSVKNELGAEGGSE